MTAAQTYVQAEIVRELVPEDLARLERGAGVEVRPIAKLRHSHHQIAQLLAKGARDSEVAAVTGYSPSRISVLKSDPTFQDLIEHYKCQVEEVFVDTVKKLATLSNDAIDELQDRLDKAPDMIDTSTLVRLSTMALDRTGHGPVTKMQGAVVHITQDDLRRLKESAAEEGTVLRREIR